LSSFFGVLKGTSVFFFGVLSTFRGVFIGDLAFFVGVLTFLRGDLLPAGGGAFKSSVETRRFLGDFLASKL
jgi:hypothetical protein